ncbi:serine hydrolase FSH [Bombardia bombarda]|uniref:Serine hydrolase FSH n=1 Tax=Bombardia bombarda TaxID=252184 RepID=A0AA39XP84_9PEZI|nr:serine hydrolase FSH [Bombardia bombarda]
MAKVRILCLHGMGTNSKIFQEQTALLRSMLPSNYIFTFIEAAEPCTPPAEIAQFFPPPSYSPYLCWYKSPSTLKVALAHQRILAALGAGEPRTRRPYDVILGFSMGASIAASLLLHHRIDHGPDAPPLVKAAVFFASPLPFARCLEWGRAADLADELVPKDEYFLQPEVDDDGEEEEEVVPCAVHERCRRSRVKGVEANPDGRVYYQMFHPSVDEVRIGIPTAHVYGRMDPWRPHSRDLAGLCDGRTARVFEHDGGHEIPGHVVEEICDVIESTVNEWVR